MSPGSPSFVFCNQIVIFACTSCAEVTVLGCRSDVMTVGTGIEWMPEGIVINDKGSIPGSRSCDGCVSYIYNKVYGRGCVMMLFYVMESVPRAWTEGVSDQGARMMIVSYGLFNKLTVNIFI